MVARLLRFGWVSAIAVMIFLSASSESALGHFPFRRHCFARHCFAPATVWHGGWCGPRFATSSGIWGGGFHRNFYSLEVGCWPSYSFSSFPIHSCAPVIYQPVIYQPVIYTPVICEPVCTSGDATSFYGYRNGAMGAVQRTLITETQRTPYRGSAQPMVHRGTRPKPTLVGVGTHSAKRLDVAEAQTLRPYSPVWADSAVGLMDDMVARGDWEMAYQACVRMDKIPSAKNHRVLLRQALLELVAHRDSFTDMELNRIMDRFSQAADAGCNFSNQDLRGGKLASYLEGSGIDLSTILDDLSRRVLEQPTTSGRELLLVSVLLTLDGQGERASLFTRETRSLAALSDSFRWQSVLRTLDRQLEQDSVLVAQDHVR